MAEPRKPQNHRIIGVHKRTHCWYRADKACKSVKDCSIAGHCTEMWNPARSEAVRKGMGGALWMHHVPT